MTQRYMKIDIQLLIEVKIALLKDAFKCAMYSDSFLRIIIVELDVLNKILEIHDYYSEIICKIQGNQALTLLSTDDDALKEDDDIA